MKVQLYTLNEIVDTLRHLSHREDSITEALKAGDFRFKFESYVSESRAKRDTGNLLTLPARLVSITHNGKDVFILDDIQGAVTKKQFAKFMALVRAHPVEVSVDEVTYIPTDLVDLFVQSEHHLTSPEEASGDELLETSEELPAIEPDEESSSLRFA